jgi:ATP-dependent helicase/nuclease subunit B
LDRRAVGTSCSGSLDGYDNRAREIRYREVPLSPESGNLACWRGQPKEQAAIDSRVLRDAPAWFSGLCSRRNLCQLLAALRPMLQAPKILPWDRPLLERAVAHFATGWSGGALDLADRLIVVPTRQAGRRLRAALAVHAAARGGAVLAPRVLVPEQLLEWAMPRDAAVATRAQVLMAWVETLCAAELDGLREVFPVDPPDRGFAWALRLAGEMARLQATLAEGGLRMADVGARAGNGFEEPRRWQQLAQLERAVDARLAAQKGATLQAVSIAAAAAPWEPPEGVRRVSFLGVPDPLPLALGVAEKWSQRIEVEVLVFGPADGAALFDEWGRPRPEVWSARPLEIARFEEQVQLCADPATQAAAMGQRLVEAKNHPGLLGAGAADPEVLPLLAAELRATGVACHLPEGRPLRRQALAGLIETLAAAVRDDDWPSAFRLARRTEVLEFLVTGDAGASVAGLLAGLDVLHAEHLPPTLTEAQRHAAELEGDYPGLGGALETLRALIAELREGVFPEAWQAALARLYGGRQLDLARAEDREFAEAAEAWRAAANEVAAAAAARLAAADACTLALQLFGAGRTFEDKAPGAVELDGWLELAFRDEPVLLVAGLNDGCAPEAVAGHAFLPESLRERLGLKTNAQRFARDAWQLAALAACRAEGGRLEIFLGKTSAAGDPLRPSRLLFQCADAELPARVRWLFRELPPAGGNIAWQRAWRWRVPWVGAPSRLRVTGFRDYLACPFRFYLKHALKMEPVDAAKRELDARDFGTLVHRVLERLGQETAWRDCTDGEALAREFDATLTAVVAARFGEELSLPLVVQVESARQRLAVVARLQAGERAAGWVIDRTEWKLPAGKLSVGGIELSGTIDRIERHEATGRWRVLDYKTSETAKRPGQAHLRSDRAGTVWLAEARVKLGGKAQRWTDLQLPLYRWALGELLGAREVEIGYFNLPKAVTETAIAVWSDFDDAWLESALRCAEAVGAGVKSGRFWPPVEEPENDAFAALVHGSAAESFDVSGWPIEARRGGAE